MSNQLARISINEMIDKHLENIITGSWVEHLFVSEPKTSRLNYHRDVIKHIYQERAERGDFNIENIMYDILDHDETELERASELMLEDARLSKEFSLPDRYNSSSWDDLLFQIKADLAESAGFLFFSDSLVSNDDIPLFVLNTLYDMKAYFEILDPAPSGLILPNTVPRIWSEFDAQEVLFPNMVEYDQILCAEQAKIIQVPMYCRLDKNRMPSRLGLKGGE